jgi:predicted alpha/beta superfamily hydrolase
MALRIFVGHCGEAPRTTLVLTDGNGLMGLAVDAVRFMQIPGLLPSVLVVGVGYPDAAVVTDTIDQRFRHLTPTPSRHREGSGHADSFVRFFRAELFPWLDARFAGAGDRIYFGHSLGGLFGVHVLLTAPDTFGAFIISSPSLWWDHHAVFEHEAQRAAVHDDLAARVYSASAPSRPTRAAGWRRPTCRPITPTGRPGRTWTWWPTWPASHRSSADGVTRAWT